MQYMENFKLFIGKILWGDFFNPDDSILTDKEILTLLYESILNGGTTPPLINGFIPGTTREKLIVSYYRYKGQSTISTYTIYLWIIFQ